MYDSKGKRYFDGLAGLFCTQIGYSFGAELGEAAATQMAELPFYTNWSYAHPRAIELAAKVAELAPGDLNRVFFVSGGSEANEAIIKLVRQYHQLHGAPPPLQDDRAPHRLPRHHPGRALADRHLPAEDAVRAADAGRPPRLEHQPLPPSRRRERAGVHAVPAGRAARRDRAGGPGLGGRRVHGAGAELRRHLHPARGLLPGRARDLRRVRRAAGGRRGDLRLRPAGRVVRLDPLRHPARHRHLRQGRRLGTRAAGRRADDRQRRRTVPGGHDRAQPRHHLRRPPGRRRRSRSRTSR